MIGLCYGSGILRGTVDDNWMTFVRRREKSNCMDETLR
jgi:hypothetical protein